MQTLLYMISVINIIEIQDDVMLIMNLTQFNHKRTLLTWEPYSVTMIVGKLITKMISTMCGNYRNCGWKNIVAGICIILKAFLLCGKVEQVDGK